MPTAIRLATAADAAGCADIFLAARATMAYLPRLHTDTETRDFLRRVVETKETWLAVRNGTPVGFAVIDGGWLEHLYVHPSRFGNGTGARLFEHLTREHPQGFQLWVFQQNAGARRFYERQGCALEKLTDGADNEEKLADALYIWPAEQTNRFAARTPVTSRAAGSFDVTMTPAGEAENGLGRMALAKRNHGDLEADAKGEMLTGMTEVKGSAVYVAMEKVTGTLKGRSGSFLLHHTGVMTRGASELSVSVVPDSGTGQLKGLAGELTIAVTDGKHFYRFDYTLPSLH